MIKIFTEAKQDYENFKQVLISVADDRLSEEEKEQHAEKIINKFKEYKEQLSPEERNLYYWIKQIKNDPRKVIKLRSMLDKIKKDNEDKAYYSDFCKIYPSNLVRRFKQHKEEIYNDISVVYSKYSFWVKEYKRTQGDSVVSLKKLLKKFGLTSEEQQEIENGSETVGEVNGFKIIKISNYEASEYYGQNTGWCISGNYAGHENRGAHHFKDYLMGRDYYYFLIKDFQSADEEDYCVLFDYDESYEIWEGTDKADSAIMTQNLPERVRSAVKYVLKIEDITDIRILSKKEREEYILQYVRENGTSDLFDFYGKRTFTKVVINYYSNNKNKLLQIIHDYLFDRKKEAKGQSLSDEEIEEEVQNGIKVLGLDDFDMIYFSIERIYECYIKKFGPIDGVQKFLDNCEITIEELIHTLADLNKDIDFIRFLGE